MYASVQWVSVQNIVYMNSMGPLELHATYIWGNKIKTKQSKKYYKIQSQNHWKRQNRYIVHKYITAHFPGMVHALNKTKHHIKLNKHR